MREGYSALPEWSQWALELCHDGHGHGGQLKRKEGEDELAKDND